MSAARDLPEHLSLDAFLVSVAPEGSMWQLADGKPRAVAPASPIDGRVQGRLFRSIEDHFESRNSQCVPIPFCWWKFCPPATGPRPG